MAPDTGIWTYRGTVPGHDDNRHVIVFTPMKKIGEAWIELAFCGNRNRFNLARQFFHHPRIADPNHKDKDKQTFGHYFDTLVESQFGCFDDAFQFCVECVSVGYWITLLIVPPAGVTFADRKFISPLLVLTLYARLLAQGRS